MINITNKIDSNTKEEYSFTYVRDNLVLDYYCLLKKVDSSKRKYNNIKHYNRIYTRGNNINVEDIIITDDIKKQVLDKFISSIKVIKWNERD